MKKFKKQKPFKENKNYFYLNLVICFLIFFCGLSYVFNMNCCLSDNFSLEAKTQGLSDLQAENQSLELQKIALETYNLLDKDSVELKMVSLGSVDYLDVSISALAKN